MKDLQIAVIGAGHLGRIHAKLLGQVDGVKLVAIADPIDAVRSQASSLFGVPVFESHKAVMGIIDAAIVASPSHCHADMVSDLLTAGKHVFVEKPITVNADDANDLVALAAQKRLTLQVGHVERFNPAWTAAAAVTAGAKYVEATRASRFPGRCLDVGVVMDLMIHDIDLVLSLTKAPLRHVASSGISVVSQHEDMAEARLEFACGLVANLKASRLSLTPARQMQTFGPNGFAEIDFGSLSLTTVSADSSITDRSFDLNSATDQPLRFADELFSTYLVPQTIKVEARNAILDELHDFAISIQSRSNPTVSGTDGLRAVEVASRILEAIDNRRWTRDQGTGLTGPHAIPREGIEAASRRVHLDRRAA